MPRLPLDEIVREKTIQRTIGGVPVQIVVQCRRDLRVDVVFVLLQRSHDFQIPDFGAAGFPFLARAFHQFYSGVPQRLGLDPAEFVTQFGRISDTSETSMSSPETNRNIVMQAVDDVLEFIDTVLVTHQAASSLYASWYSQIATASVSSYQDLISAVACRLIVLEKIMHPTAAHFDLLVFQ